MDEGREKDPVVLAPDPAPRRRWNTPLVIVAEVAETWSQCNGTTDHIGSAHS